MSLARILGKSKGRMSYISDSRWVLPTSFIGLEHEYEGVTDRNLPKHTFADFWAYHEEGSLKDNGAEYVFASPLFGVDAYNSLEWLVSHAKESKWKCTKRTGIHVHLDVRDLSVPQLAGLCILYAATEPILYRWIGDGRDVSHFCIPLYRADEALLSTCSIIRAAIQDDKTDGHTAVGLSEEFQRYAGFNLQALQKFGSIEFRQLQTTHDLERIITWINIIMSLKEAAFRLPESDGAVVRMLQRMSAREVLSYVFKPELAGKLYTPHSEKEFRTQGLPSARDIAIHGCNNSPWIASDFPRGEHKGFSKWAASVIPKPKKAEKSAYAVEMGELPVVADVWAASPEEEEEEHFEPIPAPPREQLLRTANRAMANFIVPPIFTDDVWRDAPPAIEPGPVVAQDREAIGRMLNAPPRVTLRPRIPIPPMPRRPRNNR